MCLSESEYLKIKYDNKVYIVGEEKGTFVHFQRKSKTFKKTKVKYKTDNPS